MSSKVQMVIQKMK